MYSQFSLKLLNILFNSNDNIVEKHITVMQDEVLILCYLFLRVYCIRLNPITGFHTNIIYRHIYFPFIKLCFVTFQYNFYVNKM